MVLGIKYNKMYEDLALHIKEELIKVFKADDWGEYTPSNWRLKTSDLFPRKSYSYTPGALVDADGLECFDEFKVIISEDDVFEMGIKSVPHEDAKHYIIINDIEILTDDGNKSKIYVQIKYSINIESFKENTILVAFDSIT